MNKIILSLLLIFICLPSFAQDKPWASLVSNDYKIKVDFKNQNISTIAKWYSAKSGITIIADDGLKGNFNISSVGQVKVSEAFNLLEAFLNLHNYMLIRENKFLIIKPYYKPSYKYYQPIGPVNFPDEELKVYHLKSNNASNLAKILNEIFGSR